jgi:hypothetical protein
MLFLSCKKENPSLSETPATVEIFVCNSKGEPLENKTVGLYDENRYTDFQKDHTVKPLAEVITNQKGIAHFVLESRPWFLKGTSAELMFVVQELQDASNYKWWSRGGTVTLGKAHSFKIEVVYQDGAGGDETTEEKPGEDAGENVESSFVIENGILTGIKDPSLTQVVLPAEVKSIASGAFWNSHIESLVLNEGLIGGYRASSVLWKPEIGLCCVSCFIEKNRFAGLFRYTSGRGCIFCRIAGDR